MPRIEACLDLTEFERGQIVGLKTAGWSNKRTADFVGCSKSTVFNVYRKYIGEGNARTSREKCGSKKKTTPQEDQNMLACVQQRPQTSSSRIVKEQNLNIQARTVRRRLTGFGLHSYWATRKEALTANGTNDRVSFCLEYLPVDEDNWTSFVFTDESCVSIMKNGKLRVWRRRGERLAAQFIQHVQRSGRFSVPVWGWCSGAGAGNLTLINGRLNSLQYVDILENSFLPQVNAIFGESPFYYIQDQSPIHRGTVVKQWFQTQRRITLVDLPPKSPDLNIIENAWSILKRRLDTTGVNNQDVLWERIQEVWDDLIDDVDYWQNLSRSMPRRIRSVLDMNGGHTRY